MKKYLLILITLLTMLPIQSYAHSVKNSDSLALNSAIDAAQETIRFCETSGHHITATVVDMSGQVKVQLKGDHSTIQTKDTAFRKAYTVVTIGPIFNLDTCSQVAALLKNNPSRAAFLAIPEITPLPGAVALKINGKIVAASGAWRSKR